MFLNKLSRFLGHQDITQPILVNSIPKSGTNLLKNIVLAINGTHSGTDLSLANETTNGEECLDYIQKRIVQFSPGHVYTGHIPYFPEVSSWLKENKVKQVFIYRDPRDITVSLYHYIMKEKTPRHAYYSMYSNFESDKTRLLMAITGFGEGKNKFKVSNNSIPAIGLVYQAYLPWIQNNRSDCLSLRYEDLVGTDDDCKEQFKKIVRFINPNIFINEKLLQKIRTRGMDPRRSHTYRKGVINSWKDEYTQEHITAFRSNFDDSLLNDLGYEWNGVLKI
ncbi:MAG: sulfotransferase domain-containing protein [Patescibacteria group bacterium]|nr:sulfotransferase domain-containing protein [Patescibacteria group bacterium]